MEQLRQFNGDTFLKNLLLTFICDSIDEEALIKLYKREDIQHIADAKELIIKSFDKLQEVYGIKIKQQTSTNSSK